MPVAARFREGLPAGHQAVECNLGLTGGDEATVDPVRAAGDAAGGHRQHKWFAEIVPGQVNCVVLGLDGLGPEGAAVAGLGERRLMDGEFLVGELREEQRLDFILEPAGEGDVVGIDQDFVVDEVAFEVEDMAGSGGGIEDPPVADAGGLRAALFVLETNEGVFAGEADLVGVNRAGGHGGTSSRKVGAVRQAHDERGGADHERGLGGSLCSPRKGPGFFDTLRMMTWNELGLLVKSSPELPR